MISKIGEEILGMEKLAKRIGNLSGKFSAWKVYAYGDEPAHNKVHVHVKGPGGVEYVYIIGSHDYIEKIPPSDLNEEIQIFCSNDKNLKEILKYYNNGRGGWL